MHKILPMLVLGIVLLTLMNPFVLADENNDYNTDHHTNLHTSVNAPSEQSNHAENSGHADNQSFLENSGLILSLLGTIVLGVMLFIIGFRFAGKDVLELSWVKRSLQSYAYPRIIQLPTLIFFLFIIYYFFFGVQVYADNPGSILAWTFWWPIIPITFLLLGRIWCVACPIPLFGDWIQLLFGRNKQVPLFLQRYGIWITDGMFIAITLFDRLYGMVEYPYLSGIVFLIMLFGTVSMAIMYERRAFCRYVCFLGGVSGNYSMLAGAEVVSKDKEKCFRCKEKFCYKGTETVAGCPLYNVMSSKDSARNCTLCANCIKVCPHDNIEVRIRPIGSELWRHATVKFQESFFAKLLVGVVIIQNLGMLAAWPALLASVNWLPEKIAITVIYALAIALPLLLMGISSWISNRLQSQPSSMTENFAAFGYAFIPIDLTGHVAHNLFHLLAEGWSILGAAVGLFTGNVLWAGPLVNAEVIRGAQFGLIFIGAFGTIYAAYRIAKKREQTLKAALRILVPHGVLLFILILVNLALFSGSMVHRGH